MYHLHHFLNLHCTNATNGHWSNQKDKCELFSFASLAFNTLAAFDQHSSKPWIPLAFLTAPATHRRIHPNVFTQFENPPKVNLKMVAICGFPVNIGVSQSVTEFTQIYPPKVIHILISYLQLWKVEDLQCEPDAFNVLLITDIGWWKVIFPPEMWKTGYASHFA